jgi:hypothetical protein
MDDLDYTPFSKLQRLPLTDKTPFCPGDQEIAEYFDVHLDRRSRAALVRHLADCRFCQARVGILERLATGVGSRKVPGDALARAKQLPLGRSRRSVRHAPALAAAAVVVLALTLVVGSQREPAPVPAETPPAAEYGSRELRSLRRSPSGVDLLAPAPGADLRPGSIVRWAKVPGHLHYTIHVLSRTGDVLWTERLEENEWALRDAPQFEPGKDYWFRVEAMLADGRSLTSKHLAFRIARRE